MVFVRKGTVLMAAVLLTAGAALADIPHWKVREDASSLTFVYHQGGQDKVGGFDRFTADIRLDPAAPESGAVTVTVDLTSVSTPEQDATDALLSRDWFHVAETPRATFESTTIRKAGDGYVMDGMLSIGAVRLPVSLPFALSVDGSAAHANGSLTLDRMAYGLGKGFWEAESFIAHAVTVRIDITATRAD